CLGKGPGECSGAQGGQGPFVARALTHATRPAYDDDTTPSSRREPPPEMGGGSLSFSLPSGGKPTGYAALTAVTSFVSESFASPKNMIVFGSYIRSLSMPANPGRIDLFMNTMFLAWSAFRIGMP